ncbi:RNA 2',3'-cyclic phosphate--5'-hydroxyl ligase [Flavobacterium rivuli WB 3.3-2 = DSM 21788]|uniref:3'-phosphate/5'-hydroxy nucleic acid ligase n=1 Tax=Flavobacterium rivuli WB 3.3-2 = DSM 21788 TaxID=1121895 RepID=A0A0A2MH02_9FLAO|nr:RtcB family protein [Flavobacterium rivuli]KGO87570.1 RNA 2',3'-cyclic phosphate--5'-hydroxyl ligase [Flavobacterium rivuli WB 3.3-2 = DSM 21788]
METLINGNELLNAGYQRGGILGFALKIANSKFTSQPKEDVIALFKKVKDYPESFLDDEVLQPLASAMIEEANAPVEETIPLKEEGSPYIIYGEGQIEQGAKNQMDIAMKLPVTVAGALMPDAHQGYGLPIGGVLATKNAIIPYGVGVDIGCRMALSVYDIPEEHFLLNEAKYKRELIAHTKFGAGHGNHGRYKADHNVLDSNDFNLTPFIKKLHDKAWSQLGTSGGGNHFVEFGIIEFPERDEVLNIDKGRYVALLTHSGSRGFGATVAGHYTQLAKQLCKLPKEAANLAYLDLDSQEGQEYWIAMNLAGDYASACHQVIHDKLKAALGAQVLAKVENHHNFAWKEMLNGEEVIVHRKGATPAAKGVMGIIPGSMTAPGFLVRGKGEANAINSASHGAGRQMSRTQAIKSITKDDMRQVLKDHGVSLIGAGRDEAPMAYKDINAVMASQTDLVDVVAKFTPKLVRMADDGSRED